MNRFESILKNRIEQYTSIISIWERWDESYWSSFNMFVLIITLLVAGFSQLVNNKPIAAVVCLVGISMSISWLFILNRKFFIILIAESIGRTLETEIKLQGCFLLSDYEKNKIKENTSNIIFNKWQKSFAKKSSGLIASLIIPIIIIEFWSIILGIILGQFFLEILFS